MAWWRPKTHSALRKLVVNGDRRGDLDPGSGDARPTSSSGSRATRATACSSSATASPSCPPCSATTSRRCPNFPAEIRAPAGTIAGVSSFQVHISDHDIVDAGRHAERARRDEPGGAEGEPARHRAGLDVADQRRHVRHPQPRQGRLRAEPARGRLARGVPRLRGADDVDHDRGDQAARREAA